MDINTLPPLELSLLTIMDCMIWQAMCLNGVLTSIIQITMQNPNRSYIGRDAHHTGWFLELSSNSLRVSRRAEKHPTSMLDYVGFRCIKSVVP